MRKTKYGDPVGPPVMFSGICPLTMLLGLISINAFLCACAWVRVCVGACMRARGCACVHVCPCVAGWLCMLRELNEWSLLFSVLFRGTPASLHTCGSSGCVAVGDGSPHYLLCLLLVGVRWELADCNGTGVSSHCSLFGDALCNRCYAICSPLCRISLSLHPLSLLPLPQFYFPLLFPLHHLPRSASPLRHLHFSSTYVDSSTQPSLPLSWCPICSTSRTTAMEWSREYPPCSLSLLHSMMFFAFPCLGCF